MVTSGNQRRQVAVGSPADKDASRRRGKAGKVGQPAQRLVLSENRASAFHPRTRIDTAGANHKIEQDRRLGGSGRHERQELRVIDADRGRREYLTKQPQCFDATEAFFGDRVARVGE